MVLVPFFNDTMLQNLFLKIYLKFNIVSINYSPTSKVKDLMITRITVLFLALLTVFPALGSNNPLTSRQQLTSTLDSLEVEKQAQKRLGVNFQDLELKTQSIRDSLSILRQKITNDPQSIELSEKQRFSIPMPSGLFDWIVVIIGIGACLSLIFLIFLKAHLRHTKKKKRFVKLADKFPPPQQTDQVTTNQQQKDKPLPLIPTVSDSENRNAKSTPANQQYQGNLSFNNLILKAAREGLSVQELSRRYQISTDQVLLIIKVAERDQTR